VYVGSLDVEPEEQSLNPLVVTNRQAWWVTSDISGKSYLLIQREEALLAQPFDVSTATLSGTPVPVGEWRWLVCGRHLRPLVGRA